MNEVVKSEIMDGEDKDTRSVDSFYRDLPVFREHLFRWMEFIARDKKNLREHIEEAREIFGAVLPEIFRLRDHEDVMLSARSMGEFLTVEGLLELSDSDQTGDIRAFLEKRGIRSEDPAISEKLSQEFSSAFSLCRLAVLSFSGDWSVFFESGTAGEITDFFVSRIHVPDGDDKIFALRAISFVRMLIPVLVRLRDTGEFQMSVGSINGIFEYGTFLDLARRVITDPLFTDLKEKKSVEAYLASLGLHQDGVPMAIKNGKKDDSRSVEQFYYATMHLVRVLEELQTMGEK